MWSHEEPPDLNHQRVVFTRSKKQALWSARLGIIKALGHRQIRRLRQCAYPVSRSVHQSQGVAAPESPAPRCMYLASMAAEQAFVEVHIVCEGLLDRNQPYRRDLQKADVMSGWVNAFAGTLAAAEIVAVAGDVEFVGDSEIVAAAAAAAAEIADVAGPSERYRLAAMGADL